MAKLNVQYDFNKIPAKNFIPEASATAPSSPAAGQIYYDSALASIRAYLSGQWISLDAVYASLGQLSDVTITSPATGQTLRFNGTAWVNYALAVADISGLVAALAGKANTSHSHATSDVTGLDAALAGKVDTSRTITSGTGLSGGGDLSANRTLSVLYGFTAGTALQGTTRLDQILVPTAAVALNNQKITGLGAPTADTDAATKYYVDMAVQGLDAKQSVRAATTGNITLSGTQTIDTVALVAGNRVLVKDQSSPATNGIYVVASGAWTRSNDFDSSANATSNAFVFVEEGSVNSNSGWTLSTTGTITVGTTALTWVQFSGAGTILAGAGITKTGNTISVAVDNTTIEVSSGTLSLKANGVQGTHLGVGAVDLAGTKVGANALPVTKGGTGATTAAAARTALGAIGRYDGLHATALTAGTWATVTHNLNNSNPMVMFIEESTGEAVILDWKRSTINAVQIKADVAIAANAIRVIVQG